MPDQEIQRQACCSITRAPENDKQEFFIIKYVQFKAYTLHSNVELDQVRIEKLAIFLQDLITEQINHNHA